MKKIFAILAMAVMVACGGTVENVEKGITVDVDFNGCEGVAPGAKVQIMIVGEKEPAFEAVLGEDLTCTFKTDIKGYEMAMLLVDGEAVTSIYADGNDLTFTYNEEQQMLTYGVLACLKGLQEKGCNGPVTDAISKIEKYLNAKAHEN